MNTNEVYLTCKQHLSLFKKEIDCLKINTCLEIGPGKGALSQYLDKANTLHVEINPKYAAFLKNYKVIYKNFFDLEPYAVDTLVSNLPFDQAFRILQHVYFRWPSISQCLVILPEEMLNDINGTSLKGFYYRQMYCFERKFKIPANCFTPSIKINCVAVVLTRKIRKYIIQIKNIRALKMLKTYFPWGGDKRLHLLEGDELETFLESCKNNKDKYAAYISFHECNSEYNKSLL